MNTTRITRNMHVSGSSGFCLFLIFIGIMFMLFIPWIIGIPLGIVMIIFAFTQDKKYRPISTCGDCGNEVAHTSTLCPACHAHFTHFQNAKTNHSNAIIAWCVAIGFLFVLALMAWFIHRANS